MTRWSSGDKNPLKKMLLIVATFFLAITVSAQTLSVTGNVIDENGEPVIGASVTVKDSKLVAVTDIDGNFSLKNVPSNGTINISYVGYKTKSFSVNGQTHFNIEMSPDTEVLDEVVVVGYGTQKKSDVTGALTRVGAEELNSRPVSNAFEALQGKAAGVDITSGGRPGTVGDVRIRGNRSLSASNSPLYVVDGIPAGSIESLNPRDIEAIDILKDASATAIYGSRGANGVILITTKQGKAGSYSLTYSGSVTFSQLVDKSKPMNVADFITFRRWAAYNSDPTKYPHPNDATPESDAALFDSGFDNQVSRDNIMRAWESGTYDPSRIIEYDWMDEFIRTGVTQEHTISYSGGNEKSTTYASFGYLDDQGTQKGQWYKRYSGKVSSNVTPVKWFQGISNITASWMEQEYGLSTSGAGSNDAPEDIYSLAKSFHTYALPYDADGNLIEYTGEAERRNIKGELAYQTHRRQTFRALGSFSGILKLGEIWKPLEGLTFRLNFGANFKFKRSGDFFSGKSAYKRNNDGTEGVNNTSLSNARDYSYTLDEMITYDRTFLKKHRVGLTLLHTNTTNKNDESSMSASNIKSDTFKWNNFGSIDITNTDLYKPGMSSGYKQTQLESYMVRVNYAFDDKYLLTASGRWDGASQLAPGHKWDFFPSMALGWRMSQEDFLKDIACLTNLKLRVGVGTTGNAAISAYGTSGKISQLFIPFNTGNMEGFTATEYYYNIQNIMANKELGWEKTTQWNFGVDWGFLNNRISGQIDFYTSKTKDLLMEMTIPNITGYTKTLANIGQTSNKGIEVTIDAIPVLTRDFEWSTNFNMAWQKDKIDNLANGKEDDISNKWFIGKSIGVYYGYDNLGLWQDTPEDQAEMAKWAENGYNFTPGNVRPKDQDGDYQMTDKDNVILGHKHPNWTLGWSNTLTWKGIELSCHIISRLGYKYEVKAEALTGRGAQRQLDYWTPENTNAYYQKPILSQPTAGSGDKFAGLLSFRDGGFIKMRNISLGYNFDKKLLNRIGMKNLKIYGQIINPFSIYDAIDGYDLDTTRNYYNRSYTIGLEVGF